MDNTDIVPIHFRVIGHNLEDQTRYYECVLCGWKTPRLNNGKGLRAAASNHHKLSPRCKQGLPAADPGR